MLRLFNSASGRKEAFKPLKGNTVRLYVCGITPYDVTHIGHAFTYIVFDVLARYLELKGFNVIYVQNVTNIDDDILREARSEGKDWKALGEFWTKAYLNDMKRLNVRKPTHYVRATESMLRITKIISRLFEKGFAYESGGNIYFDVRRFPRYGNLSHFTKRQMVMLLKERGGNPDDQNKRNRLDFLLWQDKKDGEPFWNAPFGTGRPGWHIECSAMINQYLGDRIDIHGGGRDLIFPHHESEIAQSESYTGRRPFSKYFMHTAMVMLMGEKMAKSLGNLVLVSDLLKKHSPNAIRWMLLSHHYRQVWEYDSGELGKAEASISRLSAYMRKGLHSSGKINGSIVKEFLKALDDDLNIPETLCIIESLLLAKGEAKTMRYLMSALGFRLD